MDPIMWILWLILGAIIGWLVHLGRQSSNPLDLLLEVVISAAGAVISGFLFVRICQPEMPGGFSTWSLYASALGSVVFLGISYLFRAGLNL